MKRIGAFLLVAVLVVALCTGCAAEIDSALVGTWEYDWALSEDADVTLGVTMKVNSDGTFALTVDAGALMEKLDQVNEGIESAGQNVSTGLEQVLGNAGLDADTLQPLLEMLFPEDKDAENGERKETATIEGRCKTEDGKLYLSLVKVVGIYGDTYLLYSVEDGVLSLSLPEDDSSELSKMLGALFPLTLQKAE